MDKLRMQTANKADDNFRKLAAMFPNAVTETINENGEVVRAIDQDVLMQEISCTVVDGNEERYQFTWPDKKKFVLLANAPINKTLRPCREESVDFDTTENLYIEGDNLEVLKLLQETYLGKIKMIYIDPPYNTGNDFVYEDDFAQSTDEYLANSGQFDEDGNRMVQNTESNGRFHTDWLNMIYPRLKLAKDLLADDGAIFISIDENEMRNLGKICDEIFGEGNFVECFVYDKKAAAKGVPPVNMVCGVHEYIFVYAKNYSLFSFLGVPRSVEGFSNPDNDPRGIWRNTNIKSTTSENRFAIVDPLTGFSYEDTWAFSQKELEKMIQENRLIFPKSGNGQVRAKEFYGEFKNSNTPIKSSLGLYDAQWNTEMLVKLMGGKYFQNPKHLRLMRDLITFTIGKNDLVLDFFSGSATTAHAVMQLNAEDGGHRKYIMVQLPEATDEKSEAYKAGYKNICEIGKERIRRAGARINEEDERLKDVPLLKEDKDIQLFLDISQNGHDAVERTKSAFERCDVSYSLDTGFRVLKCDTSNMKEVYYNPADYEADMFSSLEDNIKEDRTPEDLLFQVMLDLGVLLSGKIEETTIAGKKVFNVEDNYLIACFDSNVTEETIKAIAKQKPYYFVMRDSSMASDSVATNFDQIFATYSPDTVRKVL